MVRVISCSKIVTYQIKNYRAKILENQTWNQWLFTNRNWLYLSVNNAWISKIFDNLIYTLGNRSMVNQNHTILLVRRQPELYYAILECVKAIASFCTCPHCEILLQLFWHFQIWIGFEPVYYCIIKIVICEETRNHRNILKSYLPMCCLPSTYTI